MLRKFRDGELPVTVHDGCFRPRATEGGAGREQQEEIIIIAAIGADAHGCPEKRRQLKKRWNLRADREERTAFAFGKS